MSFGEMGRQYWKDELSKMMGVKSGAMQPTDLPEFKAMQSMFTNNTNNTLQNAIRMMSQSDVRGGKANQMIDALGNAQQSGPLQMIQNIFAQANQRGGMAADKGIDWEKFMENLNFMKQNAWQQGHDRRSMFKQQQFQDYLKMGLGGAAGGLSGLSDMLSSGVPTPPAGAATGGITSSPGGLSDWYSKMYGSPYLK